MQFRKKLRHRLTELLFHKSLRYRSNVADRRYLQSSLSSRWLGYMVFTHETGDRDPAGRYLFEWSWSALGCGSETYLSVHPVDWQCQWHASICNSHTVHTGYCCRGCGEAKHTPLVA